MMKSEQILLAPVITEKTNILREKNVYVFEVSSRANKVLVMDAVKTLFNVAPKECRIVNVQGKKKRVMTRTARGKQGVTSSWKKAYVSLKEGEVLNLFED